LTKINLTNLQINATDFEVAQDVCCIDLENILEQEKIAVLEYFIIFQEEKNQQD